MTISDEAGLRAAHEHLERRCDRLLAESVALRGFLDRAVRELATARGRSVEVIRYDLGLPGARQDTQGGR